MGRTMMRNAAHPWKSHRVASAEVLCVASNRYRIPCRVFIHVRCSVANPLSPNVHRRPDMELDLAQ